MSFITVAHRDKNYSVPVTGRHHNLNSHLTTVPDDDHARAYLMQDGNLGVPGGVYGTDTYECAPVAMAVAAIVADATGEPLTYHDLDHAMGLVVNSHDDVRSLIEEHGTDEDRALIED